MPPPHYKDVAFSETFLLSYECLSFHYLSSLAIQRSASVHTQNNFQVFIFEKAGKNFMPESNCISQARHSLYVFPEQDVSVHMAKASCGFPAYQVDKARQLPLDKTLEEPCK